MCVPKPSRTMIPECSEMSAKKKFSDEHSATTMMMSLRFTTTAKFQVLDIAPGKRAEWR